MILKLILFISTFIGNIWAGVYLDPIDTRFGKTCDPTISLYYSSAITTNCTLEEQVGEKRYCKDPRCPNNAWQEFKDDNYNYLTIKNKTLICCMDQCPTTNCNEMVIYDDWVRGFKITQDYGKTWHIFKLPECPGGESKYCWNSPCPESTESYFMWNVSCQSLSCKGKMVLDRVHHLWKCEDSTCDGPNMRMAFSSTYKTWLCQSAECDEAMMVYSPSQKKWLCNSESYYCKQCQELCAWDF